MLKSFPPKNLNMYTRIDTDFKNQLSHFGRKEDWAECYHCGNCTAQCSLTETTNLFPRKEIRNVQLGLKHKIDSSFEPWMCYYCGECNRDCPRGAEPAETMMAARRWLTGDRDDNARTRTDFPADSSARAGLHQLLRE